MGRAGLAVDGSLACACVELRRFEQLWADKRFVDGVG
jgi:hypothetical protein